MGAAAMGYFGAKEAKAAGEPEGKKSGGPPPSDYMGLMREQGAQQRALLEQQTRNNRPNQSTPWATNTWETGPDGRPVQRVALSGGLGEAATALQGQLAQNMRAPLDFSALPQLGTGESARQQASEAAYRQMASRLDPQWSQQEEAMRTRLLNQGVTEGSGAWNRAMQQLGQQRTDAYNQANLSSIREGTTAGQALFGQNMAARNQAMQELLRARQQPLSELQALQGFTAMPGYAQAGLGQADNLLGAAGMADAAAFRRWQEQMQAKRDLYGGIMDLGGTVAQIGMMASDERVKVDVMRLPFDVAPGVPAATFRYLKHMRMPGLYQGVIAQDLQKVRPEAVIEGEDGILYVGPEFAPRKIGD